MALNDKVGIIGFCLVLLVAVVVAQIDPSSAGGGGAAVGGGGGGAGGAGGAGGGGGAGGAGGAGGGGGAGAPNIMKVGLDYAVSHIQDEVMKAPIFVAAAKDPATAQAHITCMAVLNRATQDLKRSFERINLFEFDLDLDDLEDRLFDLRVWLSSASKGQNTCTDAFAKTSGPTSDKIKDLLIKSKELTVTGFTMIDKLSGFLQSVQGKAPSGGSVSSRKLLQVQMPADQVPAWTKPAWNRILQGDAAKTKAHAVVAADGSGKFKTINEAVKTIPADNPDLYIIYIKAGVYRENVVISANFPNVALIGDGPTATKVTGSKSDKSGFNTMQSATLGIDGFSCLIKDIGFENTAGPGDGPAVALRVAADKSVIVNCHATSFQDTLFAQVYRQFYKNCVISGTIDFVFGGGVAVFKDCTIIARKPITGQYNTLVAQNREFANDISGIVLDNCGIKAEPALASDKEIQSYLGRPWKPFSRMIIMNSQIEGFVNPAGWDIWNPNQPNTQNSFIGELGNKGPGADLGKRVTWPSYKKLTPGDAVTFSPQTFLKGDSWIPSTGVPY
ncbi:Pectinesterase/pectinesterase inhibitor [Heracleum sosnowskyi]|uniref:Pectinesterase n=1 Tax=Heracleum sosnowskyi TaxID=360622 RepID=A0AAD8MWG5_9APIA|nr:Pectinesterase/pectinesterase inhibitor [Heracleum sosnowskyi]